MNRSLSVLLVCLTTVSLLALSGCASTPTQVPKVEPPPEVHSAAPKDSAYPGFQRIFLDTGGVLFIAEDGAFESYDNWLIAKSGIAFHEEQIPLTAKEQAQLRILMFKARVGQTKAYGSVVRAPSACTLTQQLHLKKLLLYKSGKTGTQVNYVSSLGEAVIVAEVKDSLTNKMIFAYIEPVTLGQGVTKSASPDMDRLGKILGDVIERSYEVLVKKIPILPEHIAARAELGCTGQIGTNLQEIRSVFSQNPE